MLRRSRRRRRLVALATAGSLLAVGLALWQFLSGSLQPTQENNIVAPSSPLQAQKPTKPLKPTTNPPLIAQHPPVKTPAATRRKGPSNPYEQMLLTVHKRTVRQRRQNLAKPEPSSAVAEAIEPAARDVEPSVRDMAEASDSPTLGRLVGQQQDPAVRKELLSALFARNDRASVDVFLRRVEDRKTAADALACVAGAANPPLQTLFQCLRSPQPGRRIAAAQVLGRLDQPAVSCELIAMVARGTYRQEAMIALLSSSETTARQFVANAAQNPMLSATLWNAKRVFQTASSWRS
jgi:hypothetical protein